MIWTDFNGKERHKIFFPYICVLKVDLICHDIESSSSSVNDLSSSIVTKGYQTDRFLKQH